MKCFQFLLALIFLEIGQSYAQNKELLYDFTEVPQALMLNPGMQTGFQWYAGAPLLSGLSLAAGSSGLTIHDLFADDGLDFTRKVRDRAVYGMNIRDEISNSYRVELLSGGFRAKNRVQDFYSFGIYHECDIIVYWPRDLAILGFEGNANQLGRRFNLGHLKTRGQYLNVFHFGLNRKVSDRLTAGIRLKLYSGILDFNSTGNKGYFVTNRGQNNLLANTLVADMLLRTSGLEALRVSLDNENTEPGTAIKNMFTRRGFFGGDLGLGMDVGFSYSISNTTVLTASILDLGFLYHSTDVRNFRLEGSATIEGIEVILPDALADPTADLWQDLVDEIEALIPFEETRSSYITFRPTQAYASLRHNFGARIRSKEDCDCEDLVSEEGSGYQFVNSAGAQFYMINRPRGPQMALTAFYQRRFGKGFAVKGTYTVDKFSAANIGLGMSAQAGPVNFYLMADNLLSYRNIADSHYASLQLGLNVISWGGNRD